MLTNGPDQKAWQQLLWSDDITWFSVLCCLELCAWWFNYPGNLQFGLGVYAWISLTKPNRWIKEWIESLTKPTSALRHHYLFKPLGALGLLLNWLELLFNYSAALHWQGPITPKRLSAVCTFAFEFLYKSSILLSFKDLLRVLYKIDSYRLWKNKFLRHQLGVDLTYFSH